ncbi:MAG: tetratricopeptide repeat protein [Burkholderiaceae bacterium]|nr:tetratricopeptide repeat protein [Burkholderiaceae bacterium]
MASAAAFGEWPGLLGAAPAAPQPLSIPQDFMAAPPGQAGLLPEADALREAEDTPVAASVPPEPAALTAATSPRMAAPAPTRLPSAPVPIAVAAWPALSIKTESASPLALAMVATSAPATVMPVASLPAPTPGSVEKRVIAPSGTQRAAIAYQQAIDQAAGGHSNAAIGLALDALKSDPDHLAARELAAVLMIESKRLADAASLMRDGLERQPQQPHLIVLLARIEAESGSAQAALDRLSAAPALDVGGHGLRAALLARAERYAEAAAAYEAALRLQPDNAAWWFGLGVSLDSSGQAPLARQALQRARALGSLRGDALAYVEQKLAVRE